MLGCTTRQSWFVPRLVRCVGCSLNTKRSPLQDTASAYGTCLVVGKRVGTALKVPCEDSTPQTSLIPVDPYATVLNLHLAIFIRI